MLKGLDRADEVTARDTGVAFLNSLLRVCDLPLIHVCDDRLVDRNLRQFARGIGKCRDNRRHRSWRIVDLEQLTRGVRDRSEHHAAVVAQMRTIRPCIAVDRTIQGVDRVAEMGIAAAEGV
jgi:hypothetical protein